MSSRIFMRSHNIVKSRNVLPATSELCVCAFVAFACILKRYRPVNAAIYNRHALTHRSIAILAFIALYISIVWFLLFNLSIGLEIQITTLSFFRWIRSNNCRIFLKKSQLDSRIKRNRYPIVGTSLSENIKIRDDAFAGCFALSTYNIRRQ